MITVDETVTGVTTESGPTVVTEIDVGRVITQQDDGTVIIQDSPPIIEIQETANVIVTQTDEQLLIEVGIVGPQGPAGADSLHLFDLLANRPASADDGALFTATDTDELYVYMEA